MRDTLEAIDTVELPAPTIWTFGGGTALAIDLEHRVSYDIDIFFDSAAALKQLVPVTNEITRRIAWNSRTGRADFQWPGSYLKLFVEDKGEIDFLNATTLTDDALLPFAFEGRIIQRERPAEVIAKKLYYRGSTSKSRDIFDLAATYLKRPDELAAAAASPYLGPDVYDRARRRIEILGETFAAAMADDINPTDFGRSFMGEACDLATTAIEYMRCRGTLDDPCGHAPP